MSRMLRALVLGAAALVVAGAATAAPSAGPTLSPLTLQLGDLPGAKLTSQGSLAGTGYIDGYQRTFRFASPVTSARMVWLKSEVQFASTVDRAQSDVTSLERELGTAAGRKAFLTGYLRSAKVKASQVTLGKVRPAPALADNAFEFTVSVKVKAGRIYDELALVQLDRVVALTEFVSLKPMTPGVSRSLLAKMPARATTLLTPTMLEAPTVTGTAQQGQTLTAAPGRWSNDDVALSYQWQHCTPGDTTAASCTDVPGATWSTYPLTAADAGFSVRVVVTAKNRFGAPTAPSAVTAAVV